jgi:hypothetical protein
LKYRQYILFNRNILVAFVCAFISGAIISQLTATRFTYASNSLVTLLAEDGIFYAIFGILFYVDNRMQYDSTKQKQQSSTLHDTRFGNIKWIIIKVVSSMSIAEIEYNIVKPYVHYLLLTQHVEPSIASIIASLVGIIGFIIVANLGAHYTGLFRNKVNL